MKEPSWIQVLLSIAVGVAGIVLFGLVRKYIPNHPFVYYSIGYISGIIMMGIL